MSSEKTVSQALETSKAVFWPQVPTITLSSCSSLSKTPSTSTASSPSSTSLWAQRQSRKVVILVYHQCCSPNIFFSLPGMLQCCSFSSPLKLFLASNLLWTIKQAWKVSKRDVYDSGLLKSVCNLSHSILLEWLPMFQVAVSVPTWVLLSGQWGAEPKVNLPWTDHVSQK